MIYGAKPDSWHGLKATESLKNSVEDVMRAIIGGGFARAQKMKKKNTS